MHPSPEQPKEGLSNQKKTLTDATQQRRQSFSYLRIKDTDANSTLGDILLPFLFAAMETCWLDAIFIGPFQSYQPLMPLWAPFVLIIGSQWILSRLEHPHSSSIPAGFSRCSTTFCYSTCKPITSSSSSLSPSICAGAACASCTAHMNLRKSSALYVLVWALLWLSFCSVQVRAVRVQGS